MSDRPIRDKMHSVFSPRRQRVFAVAVGILLQAAFFAVVFYSFKQYAIYAYWLSILVSALVSLHISTRKSRLAYKVAWIVPILLLPFVGGMMYLILGGIRRPRGGMADCAGFYRENLPPGLTDAERRRYGPDCAQQIRYLERAAQCPGYVGTEAQYFSMGEAFLPAFLRELEKAERYIFLEYFIIAEGSLWSEVLKILIAKAQVGVDVRVLYDGMGSAVTLPSDYPAQLREAGIRCEVFRPFRPVLSIHQNNRDHRKLCVIDGVAGFVGGLNLADEYVGRLERFGVWKDNAVLLRGPAAWSLAVFFLAQWSDVTGEEVDADDFLPRAVPVQSGAGIAVPYVDTPLDEDTVCAGLYQQMIGKATRYCYIMTPYLVIDETLSAALTTAARSGVDVRIITPHVPDKKVVFAVTRSHYPELLEAGVKIYEFSPGFCHAKTIVADDLYASVGSCNLDYRSLYLQFENGVWLCGGPAVEAVRWDFVTTLARCHLVTREDCERARLPKRLLTALYRLFSPVF